MLFRSERYFVCSIGDIDWTSSRFKKLAVIRFYCPWFILSEIISEIDCNSCNNVCVNAFGFAVALGHADMCPRESVALECPLNVSGS